MKSIFFVTKIGSLYHVVLPLLQEKEQQGDILVVAGSDEVFEFFSKYTSYPLVRMNVHPNLITRTSKKYLISRLLQAKIEYRKLFKEIKDSEVFFFGNSFSLVVFYYVKKLSKHNTVYHCGSPEKEATVKYPKAQGLQSFLMKWFACWMFGIETTIHSNQGIPFWRLQQSFFTTHNINEKVVKKKPKTDKLPTFDFLKDKTVLFVMQDLLVYDYVTETSFLKTLDDLQSLFEKQFPGKYLIKPHPGIPTLHGKMKTSDHIAPAYIPSEFLLHHPWKFVIGFFSTSLLSASELTTAKVISLLDVVEWNDAEKQKKWKASMNNGNILFPQNMKEVTKEL